MAKRVSRAEQHRLFVELVYQQNNYIDDPSLKTNLDKMREKPVLFVVTGQQLGLLVSPLYTVYKTLSAIHFAEQLQKQLSAYSVLPLFWLEGEDHDFSEVATLHVWKADNTLGTFTLAETEAQSGFSMARRKLPTQIGSLLSEIKDALQPTEFNDQLFSDLQEIYQPGRLWPDAFALQMRMMFRGSGLLLFNPSAAKVKKSSVPFFERLISDNPALIQAYSEQAKQIKDAGYPLQVRLRENLAYIYLAEQEGQRKHLYRQDDGSFVLADKTRRWNSTELIHYLHDHPHRFSSTVLTRPLWQNWMLPVITYVAGPAEIAYWAMLKKAFALLGIPMPQLQPRASFTLVEPAIRRLMQKLAIDYRSIVRDKENFIRQKFKEKTDSDAIRALRSLKLRTEEERIELLKAIPSIDATLLSAVHKTFVQINKTVDTLEAKILKRMEENERQMTARLSRIHEHFYPLGKKQERVISSIYFINKYGYRWINTLKERINSDNMLTQAFYL